VNESTPYDGTQFWSGVAQFYDTTFSHDVGYKFVILDSPTPEAEPLEWEDLGGGNRIMPTDPSRQDTTLYWKFWNDAPAIAPLEQILNLPPYSFSGQFLNDQIAQDVDRPGNRVYVLERGGIYLANASIVNAGWTLRIRAGEGPPADKAIIMLFRVALSKCRGTSI
jgi:hypothetical protein